MDALEQRIREIERDWSELHGPLRKMLYWWAGNGSHGARDRLERMVTEERMKEIIDSTVIKVLEEQSEKRVDSKWRKTDLMIGAFMAFVAAIEVAGLVMGVF